MSKSPFIPAALDDADLDVYAFRVLCRVARRGRCTERAKSMAEGCGMGVDTVRDRLNALTKRGYLTAQKRQGQTTVYTVNEAPEWDTKQGDPTDENPTVQDPRVSEPYGSEPQTPTDQTRRDPTAQTPTPYKGTPSKVLPKGDTHSARARERPDVPDDPVAAHEQATGEGLRSQYFKDLIRARVGSDPGDLELWYAECEEWAAQGYNCRNIKNLIRKFQDSRDNDGRQPSKSKRDETYSESFQRIFRAGTEA